MYGELTTFERVYYTVCAAVLIGWCLGFGMWLLFAPFAPVVYP